MALSPVATAPTTRANSHARGSAGAVEVRGLPEAIAHEVEETADHLNANHEDTVRLIAVGHGAPADITGAEIAVVDAGGMELLVQSRAGQNPRLRIPFSRRHESLAGLSSELFASIAAARQQVGGAVPVTSVELEQKSQRDLPTFITSVSAINEVTPGLLELTLSGGLDGFAPVSPDQFFFVITEQPDGSPVAPGFTMAQWMATEPDARPAAAYYTVRRWRPEVSEMDLWVVLHDHQHGVSGWAATARPGTPVALWGPRKSFEPPAGTSRLLLVGDETALPAISVVLEQLADGVSAHVVIEAADAGWTIDLPTGPHIDTRWVYRNGDEPGTGTRLVDAVSELDLPTEGLYAFGAAETREIAAVRHHLRTERGVPAPQVRMVGYWRRKT